ncbi:MAG: hypothetical protein DRN81_05170 [Thermoproteota archaeon]|nr:MAG: hypothetical protein DRN81_05170 [Candidatus Korarchaeota archaeon]
MGQHCRTVESSTVQGRRSSTASWWVVAVGLILLFVGFVFYWNGPNMVFDDAYISFRYARNLARGLGLVFNPGERVEGYTNFLWTLLLAGAARAGIDIVVASKVLATLAGGTIVWFLCYLGRYLAGRRDWIAAVLPALLFVTTGANSRYAVSGMETLLFGMLVCGGVTLYICTPRTLKWMGGVGVLLGLAAITRPEGAMYFACLLIFDFVTGQRPLQFWDNERFALIVGFVVFFLPFLLCRRVYYGDWLPNTYYAKASGLHWWRIRRGMTVLRTLTLQWHLWPLLIMSVLSFLHPHNRKWYALMMLLTVVTMAYFVYIGGDFIVWFGPRFLMPVLPFIVTMVAGGVEAIKISTLSSRMTNWTVFATLVVLLVGGQIGFAWPHSYASWEALRVQMHGWEALGHWIAQNTPADAVVATDAAGLIPYYGERTTIDMFGLTDRHIARLEPANPVTPAHEKFDPNYILDHHPDYIVSTWMDENGVAVSAGLGSVRQTFEASYELVAVARIREGSPPDGKWIVATSEYSTDLYQQGYVTGLFQCKK